jgi:ABC-type multidrug transport system ATPase subunit
MIENKSEKSESLLEKSKKGHDKIMVEWNDISYTIKTKKSKTVRDVSDAQNVNDHNHNSGDSRVILENITGFALPGEVLAIMGPSGCGKTTLLNAIASRQLPSDKNHIIKRDVKANNVPLNQSNFGKIGAYIMQEDILMDYLTPRESLYFAARLKLKNSSSHIKKRVEAIISQVSGVLTP